MKIDGLIALGWDSRNLWRGLSALAHHDDGKLVKAHASAVARRTVPKGPKSGECLTTFFVPLSPTVLRKVQAVSRGLRTWTRLIGQI